MAGVAVAATNFTVTSPTDGSIVSTPTPTFTGTGPSGTTAVLFGSNEAMIDAAGNWAITYQVGLVPSPDTVTVYNYNCDIRTYSLSLPSCGPPTSTILIHLIYVPTVGAPVVALPVLVVALGLLTEAVAIRLYRHRRLPTS
jgi:hypothetical protein